MSLNDAPNHESPDVKVWSSQDTAAFIDFGEIFVPYREEQFRIVQEAIEEAIRGKQNGTVVDLGCGEARLGAALLSIYVSIELIAVDSSREMLGKATQSLQCFGSRFRTVQSDLRTFDAHVPSGLLAIVSSLAIHHLEHEEKAQLFRLVFESLAPGGVFVLADLTMPSTEAAKRVAARQWDRFVERRAVELGKPEAVEYFTRLHWNNYSDPDHDEVDKPASVEAQLTWMREAGFKVCDVLWLFAGHAILLASK